MYRRLQASTSHLCSLSIGPDSKLHTVKLKHGGLDGGLKRPKEAKLSNISQRKQTRLNCKYKFVWRTLVPFRIHVVSLWMGPDRCDSIGLLLYSYYSASSTDAFRKTVWEQCVSGFSILAHMRQSGVKGGKQTE